jgi:hypothetical protein
VLVFIQLVHVLSNRGATKASGVMGSHKVSKGHANLLYLLGQLPGGGQHDTNHQAVHDGKEQGAQENDEGRVLAWNNCDNGKIGSGFPQVMLIFCNTACATPTAGARTRSNQIII